jgi:hypothetical protein
MPRLTPAEKQDVIRYLEADKPLPDKYRFLWLILGKHGHNADGLLVGVGVRPYTDLVPALTAFKAQGLSLRESRPACENY